LSASCSLSVTQRSCVSTASKHQRNCVTRTRETTTLLVRRLYSGFFFLPPHHDSLCIYGLSGSALLGLPILARCEKATAIHLLEQPGRSRSSIITSYDPTFRLLVDDTQVGTGTLWPCYAFLVGLNNRHSRFRHSRSALTVPVTLT
jgi:hypothetical protein